MTLRQGLACVGAACAAITLGAAPRGLAYARVDVGPCSVEAPRGWWALIGTSSTEVAIVPPDPTSRAVDTWYAGIHSGRSGDTDAMLTAGWPSRSTASTAFQATPWRAVPGTRYIERHAVETKRGRAKIFDTMRIYTGRTTRCAIWLSMTSDAARQYPGVADHLWHSVSAP